MNSINAKILDRQERLITISVPPAAVPDLVEKEVKVNGIKAVWLSRPPSKEADDDEKNPAAALAYLLEDGKDISSLTVASICEVTWL